MNAFFRRSVWAWLICAFLLAGFLVNSISSYWVSRNNVRKTIIESSLPLTSDNVYSEIQRDLLRPIFISSLMANDTFLRDWVIAGEEDMDPVIRYLNEIRVKYGTVTSFFVSEQTKNYYHSSGLLKRVSEDDWRDSWYFRVRDMAEPYEINVDPDLANRDEMTIFINYRVYDFGGEFIGATGVGLTVGSVNRLISSYEAKFNRQIYFTNKEGKIVLRPSNSPMLHYGNLRDIDGLELFVDELLAGKQVSVTYKRGGKTRLLHCRYVPELDWYLIVEESEDELLAPYREQLYINILLAIFVTIVVAWICIIVIRGQHARIERRNAELTAINEQNELRRLELVEITRRLEAANERLIALNAEKDEFISIVAHDLRNPLNAILGLCQIVEIDPNNSELKEIFQDIEDSGEIILSLTKALLDASQIESFHGHIQTRKFELNPVVLKTCAPYRKQAERKKIRLVFNLAASEQLPVNGHADWLAICISNLVSNAVKYTPHYGEVSVISRVVEEGLELTIEDNGPGISFDDQGKMFGKFVRLSAKPTGNEASTGLGLYVVKKMCDRLGIEVKVYSQLGEGTRITLVLPL
jgi:signal transduction histidine kinase